MTNEETKKAADELIEVFEFTEHCHKKHTPNNKYCDCSEMTYTQAVNCAIASTENTINELNNIGIKMFEHNGFTPIDINKSANEQTELLNELKTRL
jgi:hypothetical protein